MTRFRLHATPGNWPGHPGGTWWVNTRARAEREKRAFEAMGWTVTITREVDMPRAKTVVEGKVYIDPAETREHLLDTLEECKQLLREFIESRETGDEAGFAGAAEAYLAVARVHRAIQRKLLQSRLPIKEG